MRSTAGGERERGFFDWFRRRGDLPDNLDAAQLRALAQDVRMTEGQLLSIGRRPARNRGLLRRMLEQTGCPPAGLAMRAVVADCERVCSVCPNGRRCRRELAQGTAPQTLHAFCPNAPTLEELRAQPVCAVHPG